MSPVISAVQAVLIGHPLIQSHDDRALDLCGGCVWAGKGRQEHAAHVAEVVAEQLGIDG